MLKIELDEIMENLDPDFRRINLLNQGKGAGSWLTTVPSKPLGFIFNKQEFRDSICLRYGWRIPNTPSLCACGEKNSIDHSLSCKKGGYIHMIHNNIRNLDAEFMKEVCKDVKIKPGFIPIDNSNTINGNTADQVFVSFLPNHLL